MIPVERIALFTDFGAASPYLGQVRLLLAQTLPDFPVIDLISDLTPFRPDLAAYLLPALVRDMPQHTIYLGIVDPGVGGERLAIALECGGNLFIGPDNGLLALIARLDPQCLLYRIDWRPTTLSPSFHGRDLFAPVVVALALGRRPAMTAMAQAMLWGADWPNELPRIIYQDGFGNLITGLPAATRSHHVRILAGSHRLAYARTFCEVAAGTPFWYENAFGLIELAVNQGHAGHALGLKVGDQVSLVPPDRP